MPKAKHHSTHNGTKNIFRAHFFVVQPISRNRIMFTSVISLVLFSFSPYYVKRITNCISDTKKVLKELIDNERNYEWACVRFFFFLALKAGN